MKLWCLGPYKLKKCNHSYICFYFRPANALQTRLLWRQFSAFKDVKKILFQTNRWFCTNADSMKNRVFEEQRWVRYYYSVNKCMRKQHFWNHPSIHHLYPLTPIWGSGSLSQLSSGERRGYTLERSAVLLKTVFLWEKLKGIYIFVLLRCVIALNNWRNLMEFHCTKDKNTQTSRDVNYQLLEYLHGLLWGIFI